MKISGIVRKIERYGVINPLANLMAGLGTGYALEKSGLPFSGVELGMEIGLPIAIGTLEYIVSRRRNEQEKIGTHIIAGSGGWAMSAFYCGDYAGRMLARLQ